MTVITYKCPNCGGDLRFHPDSQKYRCEYCLSEFDQQQLEELAPGAAEAKELGANDGRCAEEPGVDDGRCAESGQSDAAGGRCAVPEADDGRCSAPEAAVLYNCPNCGAEIVTDETTTATFCYYCHNPVVLEGKMRGEYHPDAVIPFAIDRKKALEIFDQWISRKKYIPKAFYSRDQIEKLSGVYFPYWLYSCQVDGKLDAKGVRRKTWVTGNIQYTQTQEFDVVREGEMQVDHVTRNALSKANRKLVEGVLPFEMEKLQPFHMGYLSGFVAEKRDMEEEQFQNEVHEEIRDYAVNALRSAAGAYDSIQVQQSAADLKDERWEYALMPVWTLTYKDPKSDKMYYFACNGQTGKVCGELPVDTGRLMRLFLSMFVPVFVVLLAVGYWI